MRSTLGQRPSFPLVDYPLKSSVTFLLPSVGAGWSFSWQFLATVLSIFCQRLVSAKLELNRQGQNLPCKRNSVFSATSWLRCWGWVLCARAGIEVIHFWAGSKFLGVSGKGDPKMERNNTCVGGKNNTIFFSPCLERQKYRKYFVEKRVETWNVLFWRVQDSSWKPVLEKSKFGTIKFEMLFFKATVLRGEFIQHVKMKGNLFWCCYPCSAWMFCIKWAHGRSGAPQLPHLG